ncbi:MAG: hypothetical protein OXI18_05765 [bacterium]|nr:hypothetical protein [bacterium]
MLSVVALGAICEVAEDSPVKYADEPVPELLTDGPRPSPYHPELSIRDDADKQKSRTLRFSLIEFADLSDGRRVTIRDDRGFSGSLHAVNWDPDTGEVREASWHPGSRLESLVSDPWRFETRESLTRDVIAALDPDDDQEWYERVVERLGSLGIEVDPISVEAAPYQVEFGSRVLEELEKRGL